MKINIELPDYDGNALDVIWENNSKCKVSSDNESVNISANKEALISIAKQMLYLAYNDLSNGAHIHYDSFFTKDKDMGKELMIEKTTF